MFRPMRFANIAVLAAIAVSVGACRRQAAPEPPVATPSMTLNHDKAPLGSPLEITYHFEVAPNAPPFTENYRVFAGVVDADEELMWTDDHDPPTPTSGWKPGQKIEYTRTVFIPIYPYIGDASIHMGLYSAKTQKRLPLQGDDAGQRAYKVARFQLLPQTENVFTIYKDGWHAPETASTTTAIEWYWTKKEAMLAFKNPKRDSVFYLDLDNPSKMFPEGQRVQIKRADRVIDDFVLMPGFQVLHKVPLTADQLGTEDMVDLKISVDKTFVPALVPAAASKDPRELGVRVFHAFIEPRK
jgi:hypothetical protein